MATENTPSEASPSNTKLIRLLIAGLVIVPIITWAVCSLCHWPMWWVGISIVTMLIVAMVFNPNYVELPKDFDPLQETALIDPSFAVTETRAAALVENDLGYCNVPPPPSLKPTKH